MCECGRQAEWVCPCAIVDEQTGESSSTANPRVTKGHGGTTRGRTNGYTSTGHNDQGGGSRFFNNFAYYAKASGRVDANGVPTGERHAGCEDLFWRANKDNPFGFDQVTREEWETLLETKSELGQYKGASTQTKARGNVHPTVKGIQQMLHWVKLSGGKRIGDICAGSGGTAVTCDLFGLDFVGAELCPEAVTIANARRAFWRGISPQALNGFLATGELPKRAEPSRNLSLF